MKARQKGRLLLAAGVAAAISLPLAGQSPLAVASPRSLFFTVTPCRAMDTRNAAGSLGGPALQAAGSRTVVLAGACGVTDTARAVVLNVTVVAPTTSGILTILPGGATAPNGTSAINYKAGDTRANNYVARLGTAGDLAIFPQQASGTVHVILDVTGYFEDPPATPVPGLAAFAGLATFGASPSTIAHIRDIGMSAFIDEQMALPPTLLPALPLQPNSEPAGCTGTCARDNYSMYPLQNQFFLNGLYGTDQLRQRVAWALHKVIVASGRDLVQPSRMAPYLNIFVSNAFGNFRDILADVTLNPAMGEYLNMRTSTRNSPNENYAREVLQLFSIGVVKLHTDGTPVLDAGGTPVPTYDQSVVTNGFAKIFTGWKLAAQPVPGTDNYTDPMVLVAANHDTGSKTLLDLSTTNQLLPGTVIPAGQTAAKDLSDALDNIFNHPNVGPFIGGHLIRNLVTSNPSPAYVARIAAVFNDNGSGVRGDLGAVVKAILLDTEAVSGAAGNPDFGIFRDPALFTIAFLRAIGARSADGATLSDGVLNPQSVGLGLDVFNPNSVFSYYPADYEVPGGALLAPEFGLLSATSALKRANLVNQLVFGTIGVGANNPHGTALDIASLQTLAGNPGALVDEVNLRLCHGALGAADKTAIVTAINAIPATNPRLRTQQAVYLVATSSQFQVER